MSARRLVVVSGGTSDPSSTRTLADRITQSVTAQAVTAGVDLTVTVVELRPLAADIAAAQVAGFPSPTLRVALDAVRDADALVVASPVYTAGVSGLVKSFLDALETDVLIATPVLLAATAGTARHALVVDEQLRSTFAYLRALTTPSSVFAAGDDWGSRELADRIERAAGELVVLLEAGIRERMRAAGGSRYSRVFGSGLAEDEISFDGDLMRLAAGGSARPGS